MFRHDQRLSRTIAKVEKATNSILKNYDDSGSSPVLLMY
jgi:hypothetical protein